MYKKNHVVIMAVLDCNRLCHKQAQAVSRGPLTAETRVWSLARQWDLCWTKWHL